MPQRAGAMWRSECQLLAGMVTVYTHNVTVPRMVQQLLSDGQGSVCHLGTEVECFAVGLRQPCLSATCLWTICHEGS